MAGCSGQAEDNQLVLFEGGHTIYSIVDPEPHDASTRLCEGTPAYVAAYASLSEAQLLDLHASNPRSTNHAFRDPRISCELATDSGATFVAGVLELRDSVDCRDPAAVGETGSYVEREFGFVTNDRGCYRVEMSTDSPETRLWLEYEPSTAANRGARPSPRP